MTARPRIAVIGAGPAGLSCAQRLAEGGIEPDILEKSRGIGGRVATRQRNGMQFDHGAQFLPLEDGDDLLRRAEASGSAAPWPAGAPTGEAVPWVGVPRMKDALQPICDGRAILFKHEIIHIKRSGAVWALQTEVATLSYDAVVFAAPAPQILRALDASEQALREDLSRIRFEPCHALMAVFEGRPPWPDVVRDAPDPFELIVRDSAKPGRPAEAECWVAHSTAAWSETRLELPPEQVAGALLSALLEALGSLPPVVATTGHRWRFSQPSRSLGADFAESACGTLLAGGDWARGRTVADALSSGRAMANALLQRLSR